MSIRRVPRRGVAFTAGWEGFRSCPYRDSVNVPTIGYGTTSASGHTVTMAHECISESKGKELLRRGLNRLYVPSIPRKWRLRNCELSALADAAYNLGPGVVSDPVRSTLARRLQGPEGKTYESRKRIYREELPKWVYAGGVKLEGLVKRRAAEVKLACNGDYSGRP